MGGDGVFIFLPSMCHQNGERQKPGDDGDSQMAKRGVAQLAGVDMRAGAVG